MAVLLSSVFDKARGRERAKESITYSVAAPIFPQNPIGARTGDRGGVDVVSRGFIPLYRIPKPYHDGQAFKSNRQKRHLAMQKKIRKNASASGVISTTAQKKSSHRSPFAARR